MKNLVILGLAGLGIAVDSHEESKYALANYAWTEPLDSIYEHVKGQPWQLLTPRIGEQIQLEEHQRFEKWW